MRALLRTLLLFLALLPGLALAAAIPFKPFTLADVTNPDTGKPCKAGEIIRFVIDAHTTFQGPAEDYLAALNDLERQYNALGITLRSDGDIVHKMLEDPSTLDAQMLASLKLNAGALKGIIKDAVQDCERLKLPELGTNPATAKAYAGDDVVAIEPGITLTARQFVARVNNVQSVLCSLGDSLLGELGGGDALARQGDVVQTLVQKRDELLDRLGLSRFDAKFDWQALEDVKSYAEIVAEATQLAEAHQVPSAAQLDDLRRKIDAQLPPDLQIPALPNIPSPVPPVRRDLAVKKRKDWTGLGQGDPRRFNAYATAYYEIRGTEKEEEADAEGKAGAFVFGNEINVLDGFGQLYAGPSDVHGKLSLRAFGQDVFDPLEFKESVSYEVSDPKHFHFGKELSYNQQFFIGPIPVTVAAGASAEAFVGWQLALVTTSLSASVTPGADASAFVRGAVGVGGFLSAGAEGSLELLDLGPVLAGEAGIRFDPQGIPFLTLGLNADLALDAMRGHVDAYAEYPVPRFGVPPWKTKRSTLELFNWAGLHEHYKIFNWGMHVTPFGATLTGDLVDQTDRDETRQLQDLLDLDQRRLALADAETQTTAKERAAFASIDADLAGEPSANVPAEAELVHQRRLTAETERAQYLDTLVAFAAH